MVLRRVDVLRFTTYMLACAGTVALYLAEEEGIFPYAWIATILAILAWAACDVRRLIVIPDRYEGLLAVLIWGFLVYDAGIRQQPIAQALGHVLVLLQCILFFYEKTARTYLLIASLSLPQMAIGAIVNNQFYYGLLLVLYIVLAAICLAQLHLVFSTPPGQRESLLQQPVAVATNVVSLVALGVLTCVIGVGGFLLMPRKARPDWRAIEFTSGEQLTGFDEEVTLGELGTILKSEDEVMSVRLSDESGQPYDPPDEPYWRGLTLVEYQDGKWSGPQQGRTGPPVPMPPDQLPARRLIVQEITLQPMRTDFCFALWPPLFGRARSGRPVFFNTFLNAMLRTEEVEVGPFEYIVYSPVGADLGQISFPVTRAERFSRNYWGALSRLDDSLRQALQEYLNTEVQPVEQLLALEPEERCRLLTEHFQFRGGFTYTLDQSVVDPTIDPVLDFLRNRKAGHCEYFATALALLLRAVDVRTRVVNGFKGADVSQVVTRFYVVREMHAHSWVEAAVPDESVETGFRWITLDPTPGSARRQTIVQIAGQRSWWKRFRDAARQIWAAYILNFDFTQQQELIYGPMREAAANVAEGASRLMAGLRRGERRAWAALAVLVGAAVLVLGGAFWWLRTRGRRWRWLRACLDFILWLLWRRHPRGAYAAVVRRFQRAGRRLGLKHRPTETLREFAVRVQQSLRALGGSPQDADLALALADHLYRLRFSSSPPESALAAIEERIEQLERAVRNATGASPQGSRPAVQPA